MEIPIQLPLKKCIVVYSQSGLRRSPLRSGSSLALFSRGRGFESHLRSLIHKCMFFPSKTSGDHSLGYEVRDLGDIFGRKLVAQLREIKLNCGNLKYNKFDPLMFKGFHRKCTLVSSQDCGVTTAFLHSYCSHSLSISNCINVSIPSLVTLLIS